MTATAAPPLWTRAYATAVVATCLVFVSVGVTIPLLPLVVTTAFGASELAAGLLFGASAVAAIAARPWLGPFGDRRGRRALLVGGSVVAAAGLVGHQLTSGIGEMLAARLVLGVGQAAVTVAATTLVLDLTPAARHGEASSYLFIAINGGLGAGPLLAEGLSGLGAAAPWLGAGLTCSAAGVLGLSLPGPAPRPDGSQGERVTASYGAALRTGALAGLGTLGFAGFLALVPLYAVELDLRRTYLIFLLASGTVVMVRLLAAKVPDRFGPRPVARTSFISLTAGFTVMALWPTTVGLVVGTLVMAAGLSLLVPSLVLHATEGVSEGEETRRMSVFTLFLDVSAALGPSLLGLIASRHAYEHAFLSCAGAALLGLALLMRWVPPRPVVVAGELRTGG
jgi:MFS family permease